MMTGCGSTASRLPATGNIVGALYHKLYTQSNAPEDGRNHRPKHVELIGIINKPLLLHLVGCLYYCISDARSDKHHNDLNHQQHLCDKFQPLKYRYSSLNDRDTF